MTLINERWPCDLLPDSCSFGRSRNDVLQTSPRTRQTKVIQQGRALWSASLTWALHDPRDVARLRYYLENLEGFSGSVQLWDFFEPISARITYPDGATCATAESNFEFNNGEQSWSWNAFLSGFYYTADHPTVDGAHVKGATSVAIEGAADVAVIGVLGQYVQIGRRLYTLTEEVTTDSTGRATLIITPGLIGALSGGETARLVQAGCEMRLANQSWNNSSGYKNGLVVVSAEFIETVEDFV
jgi:hypothetical protein